MNEENNNTGQEGGVSEETVATTPTSVENNQNSPAPGLSKEQNNMVMGILAYLSILVVVPYLMAKDEPFVKFHIKQGLVLVSLQIIVWILSWVFAWMYFLAFLIWPLMYLMNIIIIILAIVGIVNVIQGQQKTLPVVGQFARLFKI